MAKMQRPCWTIAFGIICLLVVPGAILTHMSLSELIPEISDLPANIVTGFDEVFKFAYLKKDSNIVKTSASTALSKCNVVSAAVTCPTKPQPDPTQLSQQKSINAAEAKAAIQNAFAGSLAVVNKIANDKYFGTKDLQGTADRLNKITMEMNKVSSTMKCYVAIPTFCAIFVAADGIVDGMAQVNKAIDTFKDSDQVKMWDDYKGLLPFLHAFPYVIVLSLLFFGIFWWRGGVCCCCRGGTKCGTFALLPSILLWLVSFVIFLVVLAVGVSVKYFAKEIAVPVLKGEPKLNLAIKHIQANYPGFWNVVFADMETGLDELLLASYFFVGAALLQFVYSMLELCCCPYRKKADAEKPGETQPDLSKTVMAQPAAGADKKEVDENDQESYWAKRDQGHLPQVAKADGEKKEEVVRSQEV